MAEEKDVRQSTVERRDFVTRLSRKDYHKPMIEKFGDKYLQYRREWDNSAKGEYLPAFPLQIDFEIIDYCNLKCIMCPRSINRGSGTKLPLADFKRVINEGSEKGLKAISFGGGDEPLLGKELLEMITYASSEGIMDIRLSTNGTLLNPELSAKLVTSGLTYITFSLDASSPETYRKIRGRDLNKVENNIKTFLNILDNSGRTLPVTRVSFVAMPENLGEIDNFVAKWSPLVDFIDIQDYIQLEPPGTVNGDGILEEFSCYQPWQRLAITAQGDIAPCCTFQGRKLLIGNIHEKSVEAAWNSERMAKLREQISTKNPPLECRYCYASTKGLPQNGKLK